MSESNKLPETVSENFEYFLNQAFSPFAILKGREMQFIFANSAYTTLMNGRQLVGKTLEDAIPEIKGQPFLTLLQNVFDTGVPYHATEIAATALFDGGHNLTTKYFNLSYTPYKNRQGIIEGVLAAGFDVTEQVELKIKEDSQILNSQTYNLFMQAPVGFSLITGDNHILQLANSKSLLMAGKREDIIGKSISEIIPGAEQQGYIDLLNRVMQNGETIHLKENPVTFTKDGSEETMYVNLVYQPYFEGKDINGVLSISTNVTELVLARKESELLRNKFETIANNIPNLAWIANADGWITWYNKRWYEYTGTTPEQMEGWGWTMVHDPETLPSVLENWHSSINTGQPFEMVFPIKGADTIFRPFLTRVIPIRNQDGVIMRWFGTNTDISKQKETERLKDTFLSIANHELKTPLTTVKAYGQMAERMLKSKSDLQTLGIIGKMNNQVNRLTRLIDDLLDSEKILKGQLKFAEEFFDFNALLIDVVDDLQKIYVTHLIKKNLTNTAQIFGDKDKLSQVINNLISNSIKYSPNADRINVTTQLQKNSIQLSIQDFGIGISKEDQKHIFDQFYRVAGENQSTFKGLGVGLFICSDIIKKHGGKLWVESIQNEGSTFHISLPLDHRTQTV
jgi:PAS domain S-box-containing protein